MSGIINFEHLLSKSKKDRASWKVYPESLHLMQVSSSLLLHEKMHLQSLHHPSLFTIHLSTSQECECFKPDELVYFKMFGDLLWTQSLLTSHCWSEFRVLKSGNVLICTD